MQVDGGTRIGQLVRAICLSCAATACGGENTDGPSDAGAEGGAADTGDATDSADARGGSTGPAYCVRPGAAGGATGIDWLNAYPALPDQLERGANYFLADGDYPSYIFDDPVTDEQVVSIKKATQANHGTDAGWDPTYGDGQAIFTGGSLVFSTSYYVVDGAVGSGRSGYGILVKVIYPFPAGLFDRMAIRLQNLSTPVTDITITHIEVDGGGVRPSGLADDIAGSNGLYIGVNLVSASNITLSSCYLHDFSGTIITVKNVTNFTVEDCVIARNRSTGRMHAEAVAGGLGGNHVYRDNTWEDIHGTGTIVYGPVGGTVSGVEVYGNVFLETNDPSVGGIAHGVVSDNTGWGPILNLRFFNNTIYNIHKGGNSGVALFGSSGALAQNNLWFNNLLPAYLPQGINGSHSYNTLLNTSYVSDGIPGFDEIQTNSGSSDPFTNASAGDFHLTSGSTPGNTLAAPYNQDPDGATRGADGVWDRGAYEYR